MSVRLRFDKFALSQYSLSDPTWNRAACLVAKRSRSKSKQPAPAAPTSARQPQPATPPLRPREALRTSVEPRPRSAADQRDLLRAVGRVALIAVVVYLNAIPADFAFDDKLIQRDPRINGSEGFWRIFVTDYWYKYIGTSADLYRPLTIASYALNFMIAGLNSSAFHAVNVVLHAAVCALVVILIDALLRDRLLALVCGLLFATHPIHAEAVTGIVGRAEILTALFLLLALYLHARQYTLRGVGQTVWLPVAGLAYFCALLSKETAIVGPGLLLLVDVVGRMRRRREVSDGRPGSTAEQRSAPRLAHTAGVLAMYVAIAAVYVWVRFLVVGVFLQKPPLKNYYLLFGHPLTTRLLTGFKVLAIYAKLLFFPVTLSADYSYRQVTLSESFDFLGPVVGMIAGLCLTGAFAYAVRARIVAVVFALGFFAVAYSVVSNLIVPIGVLVAERLMYLPSVGFCAALAWVGIALSRRYAPAFAVGWRRRIPVGLLVLVVALYSVRTVVRNVDWRDQESLYAATVRDSPECFAALFNYSAVLMQTSKRSDAQQLALEILLRAYAIRQDHFPSLVNLSLMYSTRGELEKARDFAQQGLKVQPNNKKIQTILKGIDNRLQQREKAPAAPQ